jgi:hypothetical protein
LSWTSRVAIYDKYYNSDNGFKVAKNNLYETIPKMFKNFQVSVDVYPTGIVQGWGSLVHIGLGGDNGVYGDRYPAIWFSPNSLELYIASAINGNKDHITKKTNFPAKWTTIVVQQQEGQFLKSIITSGPGSKINFVEIGINFNNRD